MIVNINARKCSEHGIYVIFQEDGKHKDAVFADWASFVRWLDGIVPKG